MWTLGPGNRNLSINQSNTSFYSYSSTYFFDDFVILFPFITSSLEFVDLSSACSRVPRDHLLAVTSGRIAVVRTKVVELSPLPIVRSNWLARLNV